MRTKIIRSEYKKVVNVTHALQNIDKLTLEAYNIFKPQLEIAFQGLSNTAKDENYSLSVIVNYFTMRCRMVPSDILAGNLTNVKITTYKYYLFTKEEIVAAEKAVSALVLGIKSASDDTIQKYCSASLIDKIESENGVLIYDKATGAIGENINNLPDNYNFKKVEEFTIGGKTYLKAEAEDKGPLPNQSQTKELNDIELSSLSDKIEVL